MAGGPSHLETFDYKPTLARMHGQPMPESFTRGMPIAQLQGHKLVCLAPQHPFQRCGPERPGDQHDLPAPGHGRRRALHHPLDGDRGDQPRPGPHLHEHGHDDLRPAGDGLVDQLRPGQRERRSARLRRPDLRRAGSARPSRSRRGNGTAGSCPAGSRAFGSTPRATRCSTWAGPSGTTPDRQRDVVDAVRHARFDRRTSWSTTPRSPRGSPPTRRRSGCRPACRS